MAELLVAASITALATGVGAIPVWILGARTARLNLALTGVAAGVMTVAAIQGLLIPAGREGSLAEVAFGFLAGLLFLLAARGALGRRRAEVPRAGGSALLVFIVLLVHSLPEGFAIGTAYASDPGGLGLFVVAAIAIQNIPEGTSIAIPMAAAGRTRGHQFWAAVASSVPQPVGAAIAFVLVEEIEALLAISFAFAAGAMLALVPAELGPRSRGRNSPWWVGGTGGALAMLALGAALADGVP